MRNSTLATKKFDFALATLVDRVPATAGWIYEVKLDGYRIQARIDGSRSALFTRRGQDYSSRYPEILKSLQGLKVENAVIDGEAIILDAEGKPNFQLLQNAARRGESGRAIFYAFDLLFLDGEDLRSMPLIERKRRLRKLLSELPAENVRFCQHFEGSGEDIYAGACRLGMEGIICKRKDGHYEGRRTRGWLKLKCKRRQEFVLGGFTRSSSNLLPFGALLIGHYGPGGKLIYSGRVGSGFTAESRRDLFAKFGPLIVPESPFATPLDRSETRGVMFIKPALVAEVEFSEWTDEWRCRHPVFRGLREDKKPAQVTLELPANRSSAGEAPVKDVSSQISVRAVGADSECSQLSNPDRPIYRDSEISKRKLAEFYTEFANLILPHYVKRPLVLVRCPEGGTRRCFFQKHVTAGFPERFPRIRIEEGEELGECPLVRDVGDVIDLIQLNTVEFHGWNSRAPKIENPDRMIFDLDPSPEVEWRLVARAARNLKKLLEELRLESYVKTSGGKGLHVIVPLALRYSWEQVRGISEQIAKMFSSRYPGEFVLSMSKARRRGKIFIDFFRNQRGATTVLAYSPRARPGTPLSVPVDWDEISRSGDRFTLSAVQKRLRRLTRDPWQGIEKQRQLIGNLARQ